MWWGDDVNQIQNIQIKNEMVRCEMKFFFLEWDDEKYCDGKMWNE